MAQEACHIPPYRNLLLLVIGRGCSHSPLVGVLCHHTAQTLASGAGSQTAEVDHGMEEVEVFHGNLRHGSLEAYGHTSLEVGV